MNWADKRGVSVCTHQPQRTNYVFKGDLNMIHLSIYFTSLFLADDLYSYNRMANKCEHQNIKSMWNSSICHSKPCSSLCCYTSLHSSGFNQLLGPDCRICSSSGTEHKWGPEPDNCSSSPWGVTVGGYEVSPSSSTPNFIMDTSRFEPGDLD